MRVLHDELFGSVGAPVRHYRSQPWVYYDSKMIGPALPVERPLTALTSRPTADRRMEIQLDENVTVTVYMDTGELEDRYRRALNMVQFAKRSEADPTTLVAKAAAAPMKERSVWQSILTGLSSTFGLAPTRRRVETPEETFAAIRDELGRAIKDAKARA